jgi:hypothetical protein
MPRGKILTGKEDKFDDFRLVDDFKLRLSLSAVADKISEQERNFVYEYYTSPKVIKLYSDIRRSGIYQSGSKDKSRRKILELPPKMMDFLDVVMGSLYGPDWLSNRYALNHELVKPFLLVERL